jgi:hypothetical protein
MNKRNELIADAQTHLIRQLESLVGIARMRAETIGDVPDLDRNIATVERLIADLKTSDRADQMPAA